MAKDLDLAKKVKAVLDKEPTLTVAEIAESVDASVADVTRVLDEHLVGVDGKIAHKGAGGGGGWLPEPEPEAAE